MIHKRKQKSKIAQLANANLLELPHERAFFISHWWIATCIQCDTLTMRLIPAKHCNIVDLQWETFVVFVLHDSIDSNGMLESEMGSDLTQGTTRLIV